MYQIPVTEWSPDVPNTCGQPRWVQYFRGRLRRSRLLWGPTSPESVTSYSNKSLFLKYNRLRKMAETQKKVDGEGDKDTKKDKKNEEEKEIEMVNMINILLSFLQIHQICLDTHTF